MINKETMRFFFLNSEHKLGDTKKVTQASPLPSEHLYKPPLLETCRRLSWALYDNLV